MSETRNCPSCGTDSARCQYDDKRGSTRCAYSNEIIPAAPHAEPTGGTGESRRLLDMLIEHGLRNGLIDDADADRLSSAHPAPDEAAVLTDDEIAALAHDVDFAARYRASIVPGMAVTGNTLTARAALAKLAILAAPDEAARLREAEAYIAALRGPLLYYFGTTDPDLLADQWADGIGPALTPHPAPAAPTAREDTSNG